MTAPRIACVVSTAAAGTGLHAAMLAHGCAARGLSVTAFGPEPTWRRFARGADGPGGADGRAAVRFAPVDIADRPRPARDATAVLRLRRLLAGAAPDIVHAHGMRAGAITAAALAVSPRPAPALAVTVHNAPPDGAMDRLVYAVLERVIAWRADAVLCVSRDLAARMRRRGAADVGHAVVPAPAAPPPPAGAVAAARAAVGAAGRPMVLAVGRLAAQKGFGVLLRAAAGWQHLDPRPLLAIAGEGPLGGELAAAARDTGLDVTFLGRRDDVPALMAAADVVVVPSRWEGQPLVVQEALRAGRPIVASLVGGIPELTGDDAALLVPQGEAGQLAEAVLAVLGDPELARSLRTAALKRADALPSEADALDAAIALYRRLAARRGRPG